MKRFPLGRASLIASLVFLAPVCGTASAAEGGEAVIPQHAARLMYDPRPSDLRVPAPAELILQEKGLMSVQATISVNYLPAGPGSGGDTCIAWTAQAQAAFAFAASVWASQVQSSVPITIDACYANNLGQGVLGHAGANALYRDFTGAPIANTWFPVALANALKGSDIDPTESDIYAAFSSTFNWYYGTDGNTPLGQMDFVSVVLHEIGHGLGFSGSMAVSGGSGSWGSGSGFPFRYDRFTENAAAQKLINTAAFPNPSAALATQLQSNNIFFNGANANSGNGGGRVPLYAPATWSGGSSYSHLAESYNGTANALMTFSLSSGESIHSPGPVTLGLFKDLGWTLSTTAGTFGLSVSKVGSGTVTSAPGGISCGVTCAANFTAGTPVTLTATPAAGYLWGGWSGACTGMGTCHVTMNAAASVTATFTFDMADTDGDGIPNGVEIAEARNPMSKDNDLFSPGHGAARLFAMQQYRDFLGREGDSMGIGAWSSAVAAGTLSRPSVIDAFLNSAEFAGFVSPVVRLYFATFLRVPDYAGLTFNGGLVRAGTVTLTQLADYFTVSPEFQARYGSLDNTAFVTLLYNNVLGRAPDPGGLSGWVGFLNGGMSRGRVLLGFSDSVEYQAAMANEVVVTMMYTAMLRRTPDSGGFSGWLGFLDTATFTREQVINGFFLSTEYRSRFLP